MREQLLENLSEIGLFVAIIAITIIVAFVFQRIFTRFIQRSSIVMRNDPTNYKFLKHVLSAVIYILGFSWAIYTFPPLRTVANSLLAGAAILTVAAGFASQQALSNVVSGIFIVVFKPFRVNDRLTIKDTLTGVVEDITLRHTVIRDFNNRRIIIPNSVISEEIIINADLGDERICRWIEVGISYDSNVELAKAIMREETLNHPLRIDGRSPKMIEEGADEVPVRLISLGDFAVTLRAWAWANDQADAFVMHCDLLESIKKRFDNEGIEIPFPYRTLVFKKDLEGNPSQEPPSEDPEIQGSLDP